MKPEDLIEGHTYYVAEFLDGVEDPAEIVYVKEYKAKKIGKSIFTLEGKSGRIRGTYQVHRLLIAALRDSPAEAVRVLKEQNEKHLTQAEGALLRHRKTVEERRQLITNWYNKRGL
jgi:hypothetical protein